MDWREEIVAALAAKQAWAYHGDAPLATEPAALAALALVAHGRFAQAEAPLAWLESQQLPALQSAGPERRSATGAVGVMESQDAPHWPTAQAVLAWWHARQAPPFGTRFKPAIASAIDWILATEGTQIEPVPELGHDSMIIGWPWVESTHSWLEPTSWCVLALSTAGEANHPRTREGRRLLVDRLLPEGGANYGNTFVLGQKLRPHLQPTGICMLALAGQPIADPRLKRSLDYLRQELSERTATISLCYGLLGLAAHGQSLAEADDLLAAAARRTLARDGGAHKLALLALAALGGNCPLASLGAGGAGP